MTAQFCIECGAPAHPGDRYCRRCGRLLAETTADLPRESLRPGVVPHPARQDGSFSVGGVVEFGWTALRADFWSLVGMFAVGLIGPIILSLAIRTVVQEAAVGALLAFIASFVVGPVLTMGLIRISLKLCDGRRPEFADLVATFDLLLSYIGLTIIIGLIMFVVVFVFGLLIAVGVVIAIASLPVAGVVIAIVGGLGLIVALGYLALRFAFAPFFLVDRRIGPLATLNASSRITAGIKGRLLLLVVLSALIVLAGFAALIVGIFAAYPVVLIAWARAYRLLLARHGWEVVPAPAS